jgi:hypothetical protein
MADSYETLKVNPNVDIKKRYGKNDNMKMDNCNETIWTKDEVESTKSQKYYLTEFEDLNPDSLTSLTRGINFNSGSGVDANLIDTASFLRDAKVSKYQSDGFGPTPLPTTASFARGHGNVVVESNLIRPLTEKTKKSCDPLSTHYYERTMSVFSENTPSPFANIDDFFMPNDLQYGRMDRGDLTKKYDRSYTSQVKPNCKEF